MIEFRDVCFSYGDKRVINNLSFSIPAGEARVIMGQSGSGKSTILRLILGLVKPDCGEILVENISIESLHSPLDEACDPVTQHALPYPSERRSK